MLVVLCQAGARGVRQVAQNFSRSRLWLPRRSGPHPSNWRLFASLDATASSTDETIDLDDALIVQPDNPDSPKMFRVLQAPAVCPSAKYVISWLNPIESHIFVEDAVIGWYLNEPELEDDGTPVLDVSEFVENEKFKTFLHSRIQECLENREDANLEVGQVGTVAGAWANVVDTAPWRVGAGSDPTHTIGSIRLDGEGNVESGTYTPNPTHRLLTPNGLFRLPHEIQQCLLADLEVKLLDQNESTSALAIADENACKAPRLRYAQRSRMQHKEHEQNQQLGPMQQSEGTQRKMPESTDD